MEKILYIMRGLPWTGKSTRAKELTDAENIFSTDDFWYHVNKPDKPDEYSFNHRFLGQAHKWNQLRAQDAINRGVTPICVDNTNTTAKEFCCDYAKYAQFQDYRVIIAEPSSDRWEEIATLLRSKKENKKLLKNWAERLAKGSEENHNVPQFAIERMMWRWEVDLIAEEVIANCLSQH